MRHTSQPARCQSGPVASIPRSTKLARDLVLLEGLADAAGSDGAGVVQLADATGLEKSQVSRSLRALEATGLVERDGAHRRFRLGATLYALAARTAQQRLIASAPAVLRPLAAELNLSVHLGTLHGRDVLTVRSAAPPDRATPWGAWEGRVVSAHATSSGRVLLAGLPPEEVRALYAGIDLAGPGPGSRARTVDDLLAEIALAHRRGWALVEEEWEAGRIGAAAPVRDFRGQIVAAINATGDRDDRAELEHRLGPACADAAERLSTMLGAPAR